jgi:hypothetical protein
MTETKEKETVHATGSKAKAESSVFGAIPGLLGVSTNGPEHRGLIYGSQGEQIEGSDASYALNLHFEKHSGTLYDPSVLEPGFMGNGRYSANPESREVRYSRKLPFGYHAQFILKASEDEIWLTYNSSYKNYSDLVITFHPLPEGLASIFTYYLLLEKGYLSLHCSAVRHGKKNTAVIFALPDTGKTQTAYRLTTDHRAKLISEDIAVFDGQQLFGCPFTRSGPYFLTKRETPGRPWSKRAHKERLVDYMDPDSVHLSGPVPAPKTLFLLRPGNETKTRRLSADEAFATVYSLNSCEFEAIARPQLLDVVGLLNWPDLQSLDARRQTMTKDLVSNCQDALFEITAPSSEDFSDLVQSVGPWQAA